MDYTECCNSQNIFQVSMDGNIWYNVSEYIINSNNINEILLSKWDSNMIPDKNIKYIRYALTAFVECAMVGNMNNSIPVSPFSLPINSTLHQKFNNKRKQLDSKSNRKYNTHKNIQNNIGICCQTPSMCYSSCNYAHCNFEGTDYKYANQSWIKFRDAINEC
eukprot:150898_1